VGLTVRTADGSIVGTVDDVLHSGQDVLVVRPSAGSVQILIPFVKEIVPEVDVSSGVIVITPPPGLLNLGEAP
jgi:16S rRNA processing protein RimM